MGFNMTFSKEKFFLISGMSVFRQTDRQTDRLAGRQTDRQAGRQTDRQAD